MVYCLSRWNISESSVSEDKKNAIVSYLRYIKSNGGKANLKEIKRIINDEII